MNNYDLVYSMQKFFEDNFGLQADWIGDGYEYPTVRPFVTIELISDERIERVKNLEALQIIEHLQIGYHAKNIVDRTKQAEKISDALTFNKIPYFNTDKSIDNSVGFFRVKVTSVVPIGAEDINKKSEYHRVYFDIEIEKIKRRG